MTESSRTWIHNSNFFPFSRQSTKRDESVPIRQSHRKIWPTLSPLPVALTAATLLSSTAFKSRVTRADSESYFDPALPAPRGKVLITGASSGLGAGMARIFASKGYHLALCARRVDRLEELKAELTQLYPGTVIAVAGLDVNDHDEIPKVFTELNDEIGGIDRIIVNAGVNRRALLGSGNVVANKETLETNLVAALVQIEAALGIFSEVNKGHLVLISSVTRVRGVPGRDAAYAASKAGLSSLGESLLSEYAGTPIKISVIEPGYIESELLDSSNGGTMLMTKNTDGAKALVDAIEAQPARAVVPRWPWIFLMQVMRLMPRRLFAKIERKQLI